MPRDVRFLAAALSVSLGLWWGCDGQVKPGQQPALDEDEIDYAGPPQADLDDTLTTDVEQGVLADAFVRSGDAAAQNYGLDTRVRVDQEQGGTALEGYLRFVVPQAQAPDRLLRARLRVYVTNGSADGVDVFAVSDTTWDERTVSWSTKPSMSSAPLGRLQSSTPGSFVVVDVTQAVRAGEPVSFGLRARSADGFAIASREEADPTRHPTLLLDVGTGEPTDPEPDGGTPTGDDTVAPTVTLSSPGAGATFTTAQVLTLSATATDDVGVTAVEFLDGASVLGTDNSAPFTFAWSLSSAQNGAHTLTARAKDAAGNVGTSAAVSVTVNIQDPNAPIPTEANLKVAFIGDTGAGTNFKNVLNLVKREKAAFIVHQGDFDYANNSATFFTAVDAVMGANYAPYFASIGNHDDADWADYSVELKKRWAAAGAKLDDPNILDEMYTLEFKGLSMLMVGQNGNNTAFATYLKTKLAADKHVWRVCSWHKNQNAMQVGGKANEMGWDVYENCRAAGALILTGHEHSYSRTFTLSNMTNQTVDTGCHPEAPAQRNRKKICLGPGRTTAIVTGLGGVGIRNQDRCLPATYPYGCKNEWASIYASDQGATYGALFIVFNVDGNPKKAHAYFKNINDQLIDEFDILQD